MKKTDSQSMLRDRQFTELRYRSDVQ